MVDDYIDKQPKEVQKRLRQLQKLIKDLAPSAEEVISYGIPAYKLDKKPLIYFAAFKHHIGLYATPTGHAAFADRLSMYKRGKGSVQFPLANDLPWDLIKDIVRFRIQEMQE